MMMIDSEKLKDWLYCEAAELRDLGRKEAAHEASYVLKHVRLIEQGEIEQ